MLNLKHLSVNIRNKYLLNNISLTVAPGEVIAVVGPNGAGKSTLLKIISGDRIAYEGRVNINGKSLTDWPIQELACIRGVLPQHTALSFPFTVEEVILMGRSPHHRLANPMFDRAIAEEAMKLTDTFDLRARRYTTLSGGERQRTQMARVLAQIWQPVRSQNRYLLLDEPTSALDLAHQHGLLTIARRFATLQNVSVVVILHDLNLAAQYADRIAVLKAGKLIALDTPVNVLKESVIQQTFGYPVVIAQHPQTACCPLVVPYIPSL